jgi:protoheme IX farnesyltransferase
LLAAKGHVAPLLFFGMLAGTCLVIASACVFNNYIDRSIDHKMARTKKRALVTGFISGRNALIYATILGIIGFTLLITLTNILTVVIGLIGFVFYVVIYGLGKRKSVHGTIIGTIPGAAPIVAGYCAVTGRIDLGAAILFFIMVFWQMPHFYGIALARLEDYTAAGIPLLPVKRGAEVTKRQMLFYIVGFIISTSALSIFGYTGYVFAIAMAGMGIYWLLRGVKEYHQYPDEKWGRKMFLRSLVALLLFSFLLSLSVVLP